MHATESITILAGCTPCECGVMSACAAESLEVVVRWIVRWLMIPLAVLLTSYLVLRKWYAKNKNTATRNHLKRLMLIAITLTVAAWLPVYLQHRTIQQSLSERKRELEENYDTLCPSYKVISDQDRALCNEIHYDRKR